MNKIHYFLLGLFFLMSFVLTVQAGALAEKGLEPFKDFLEKGTYEGQDWSPEAIPKSRYETFKASFNHFEDNQGKIVVELGTSRSFTHGGHRGCNSDNTEFWTPDHVENWDWGAGFFTRMAALSLDHLYPEIHTIDIAASHIARCQYMMQDYNHLMTYHICSSVDFLKNCDFPEGIDLLYIDTGDMTPIEPTALLQLEEAIVIVERDLLSPHGLILIDDVKNTTPRKFGETSLLGKAKYSLPYFLEHGFEIVMDEYQVILRKKR